MLTCRGEVGEHGGREYRPCRCGLLLIAVQHLNQKRQDFIAYIGMYAYIYVQCMYGDVNHHLLDMNV